MFGTVWLDRLGVALSLACSIHCAVAPALFAFVPSLVVALHSFHSPLRRWSIGLITLQAYEMPFVLAAVGLAVVSAGIGWRRHRHLQPLAWIAAAAVSFLLSWSDVATSSLVHGALAAVGGAMLAAAHLSNLRSSRPRHAHQSTREPT
jgi:hypothetical protein